jgi:hypothetical protein
MIRELSTMKLRAEHFDGFTEHLVSWTLNAEGNTATIVASWSQSGGRKQKTYSVDFPDSRIEQIAAALLGLKSKYDGHVDDFPTYALCVNTNDGELKTVIHAGINWPEDEKPAVAKFMSVWRPISREVENLLSLPNRR